MILWREKKRSTAGEKRSMIGNVHVEDDEIVLHHRMKGNHACRTASAIHFSLYNSDYQVTVLSPISCQASNFALDIFISCFPRTFTAI